VFYKWNDCFKDFKGKQSNNNTAQILQHTTIKYGDYIQNLNRNVLCIDDIRSVFTNKHKYNIIYTDRDTWLTQTPNFIAPQHQQPAEELFSFE
jgi:hypothetical protein